MLKNYSPTLNKYKELWAKYYGTGEKAPGCLKMPKISSQEDSVKWSLVLKNALDTLAKEQNKKSEDIIREFLNGANGGLIVALSNFKGVNPQEIIDRFELFFDFNGPEDLFLSDGNDISCVISFE